MTIYFLGLRNFGIACLLMPVLVSKCCLNISNTTLLGLDMLLVRRYLKFIFRHQRGHRTSKVYIYRNLKFAETAKILLRYAFHCNSDLNESDSLSLNISVIHSTGL